MAALFATSRPFRIGLTLAVIGALAPVSAETPFIQAPAPMASTAEATRVARLARDLERAESVRAVKRLQAAYAQYAQAGLWNEMAQLFSDNAEVIYGADRVQGRDAAGAYFLNKLGGGVQGMPPGALLAKMIVRPVVTLSQDGATAQGRWSEFSTSGRLGAHAEWAGGIHENDYVKERGVWKIARLHYHVQYAGSYDAGWLPVEPDTKVVPYHFTAATVGTPAAPLAGDAGLVVRNETPQQLLARVDALDQRLGRLVEEDAVTNLQNIYGYYIDRKMWDDVADLFTDDGVLSVANLGDYIGARSIRRGLERDGPQGLSRGQLNDHVLFDTIAEVAPGGTEGRARGLDLSILGDTATGTATLGVSVFETRFAKIDGKWRIREMRIYPAAKTDYYQGWAKSAIVDPPPAAAPDRPARTAEASPGKAVAAGFFFRHPVTGKPVSHPRGTPSAAALGEPAPRPAIVTSGNLNARLDEAERKLRVATAYDGVENISSAFGDWLDDFKWESFSALFAEKGRRRKYQVGFYVGPERILKAETTMYGPTRSPRTGVAIHYRMQPVIDVSPDGRAAKLRTRLFHISINNTRPGVIKSGMYPNDAAVLENGAWRFMNSSIDESYFESSSYKDGWARAREAAPAPQPSPGAARQPTMMERLVAAFPPDTFLKDMPNRQQGFIPGAIIRWPDIVPMWFHYVNPISGRVPQFYCADEFTCEQELARTRSR
jgi:hypothetical protein